MYLRYREIVNRNDNYIVKVFIRTRAIRCALTRPKSDSLPDRTARQAWQRHRLLGPLVSVSC